MIDWLNPSEEMLAGLQAGREEMEKVSEVEINKLTDLNKKLIRWHRKAIRHSMHLEDKLEKVYANLRLVNESLIAKDYIAAIELLSEILEGE